MKYCERQCGGFAQDGKRYCKACEKVVLAEMKESGYLTPRKYHGDGRTSEQKEDVKETKYGKNR